VKGKNAFKRCVSARGVAARCTHWCSFHRLPLGDGDQRSTSGCTRLCPTWALRRCACAVAVARAVDDAVMRLLV
jgi:hypothetical protein